MNKIFIHTDVLQHLFWMTCSVFCAAGVISSILTLYLYHQFFFSITPLHSYDDTALASTLTSSILGYNQTWNHAFQLYFLHLGDQI